MINYLFFIRLIFFLILTLIIGCKCGDITCPPIRPEYLEWNPFIKGDVIRFENALGHTVEFKFISNTASGVNSLECDFKGIGKCNCPTCITIASSSHAATTDTTWRVNTTDSTWYDYKELFIEVLKLDEYNDSMILNYSILDQHNTFSIGPSIAVRGNDSILPSFTVNSETYFNVIVHQTDTLIIHQNPIHDIDFVFKSYYNKEYGIIAFYELKTQSLFYRKP